MNFKELVNLILIEKKSKKKSKHINKEKKLDKGLPVGIWSAWGYEAESNSSGSSSEGD